MKDVPLSARKRCSPPRIAACFAALAAAGCGSYASPAYLGEGLLVVRGVITNPDQAPVEPGVELSLVWDGAVVAGSNVVEPRLPSDFLLTLYAPPSNKARGEIVVLTPAQLDVYIAGSEPDGAIGRADRFRIEYDEAAGAASEALGRNGFSLLAQRACPPAGPCGAPYEQVPLETPVTVVIRAVTSGGE